VNLNFIKYDILAHPPFYADRMCKFSRPRGVSACNKDPRGVYVVRPLEKKHADGHRNHRL